LKASAVAYPIQGLIKYHGLKDFDLRLPYHDSISVCTAPTRTHTTVEFGAPEDSVTIDGKAVEGREKERVMRVVDAMRGRAHVDRRVRMVSQSNFPKYVGLGSSASGFAALATACNSALRLGLDAAAVSEFARLGAGSATRGVAGGFAEWVTEASRSFGRMLVGPGEMPWVTLAVVARHDVPTEGVHREAMASPFFQARLAYLPAMLEKMRRALAKKDAVKVMELAETDTLNLHAITLTMPHSLLAWRGLTVETMHAVRRLRTERKVPVYFSIDTGATVYVNTLPEHEEEVRPVLEKAAPGAEILRLEVGPPAAATTEHLF
jgi:phosphomevalonate decarboxylase